LSLFLERALTKILKHNLQCRRQHVSKISFEFSFYFNEAQVKLGRLYRFGNGVEEDHQKALKYFRAAAAQDDALGQANLGVMHEYGLGVEQSHEAAVKWYRAAADQGNATGQYYLGDMYEFGNL